MKTNWTEIIVIVVTLLLISIVLDAFAAWDNDLPADGQGWNIAAGKIRDNWDALEVEFGVDIAEGHPYYQSAAPSTKPDGSTALDVDDNGRLWIDSDDNAVYVLSDYSGPTWTNTSAATGLTEADATFTLQNTDEEDSDGGRQSRFISKGEQSGGEPTTLGYIEFSHDGTSDDHKGQFLIKLNDGDDTNAPSKQPIGYLSTGKIDVSSSLSVLDEDDLASDDDEVVATQQSIKAYVDLDSTGSVMHDATGGFQNVDINGTKTKVYTKYFTGTLDADSSTSVAHGVTYANILSVTTACYNDSLTRYDVYDSYAGASADHTWRVYYDATYVKISDCGANIQGNAYRIKIDYTI